ncbi:MAG TPA: CHAT domain-containing tetratricopeptide repeat protein [bacterium]
MPHSLILLGISGWIMAEEPAVAVFPRADADRLQVLGDSLESAQELESALEKFQSALLAYRQLNDRANEAAILKKMGGLYYDLDSLDQALSAWQSALDLFRDLRRQGDEAEILKSTGWIYDDFADYPAARRAYEQSLSLARQLGDLKLQGQCLNNLGVVFNNLSDYPQALEHYQQSLQIRRQVNDLKGEATTLNNIGMVYDAMTQHRRSLEFYQQSLTNFRQLGDEDGEGRVLGNIGVAYKELTDFPKALEYYRQSLEIKKRLENRRGEAITLNNIGIVYDLLFDPQRALQYYQRSLDISRELSDRKGEGETLDNIGIAWKALGDCPRALEHLQQALAIKLELGDKQGEGITLSNLGAVHEDLGNYSRALEYYLQDLQICVERNDQSGRCITLAAIGNLHARKAEYAEALKVAQEALEIALELQNESNLRLAYSTIGQIYFTLNRDSLAVASFTKALALYEKARGRLKVESQKSGYARGAGDIYEGMILALWRMGDAVKAYDYAERCRSRAFLDLLATADLKVGESRIEQYLHEDQHAGSARTSRVEDRPELEVASPVTAQAATLRQVQEMLGHGTALLEYFVAADRTLAWLIASDEVQTAELPIGRQKLTEDVKGFRDAIINSGAVEKRSKRLYETLLTPVWGKNRIRDLIIVPHDILHYLPFQALRSPSGEYWADSLRIRYLPSASTLKFLKASQQPKGQKLLALGNPATSRDAISAIPFAEDEIETLAHLYPQSEIFEKEGASEARFKTLASGYDLLHLACHSDLDAAYPLYSSLLLAPGSGQDGELYVHEIFTLDLKAKLVVLSACQTGVGRLTSGDELVGLARAFINAGVPSVVASLWRVEDRSTAFLMERFYEHLKTADTAQALNQAQQDTRRKYPHPYSWAGFVLLGNSN